MKIHLFLLTVAAFCLSYSSVLAQFGPPGGGTGGPPSGPRFDGCMAKLFGGVSAFSAAMEMESKDSSGKPLAIPGNIFVNDGKSRFEMDMTQLKGAKISPEIATQMKAMGMDKVVRVRLPDRKLNYAIYPALQAYTESAIPETEASAPASEYKIEVTELGKETLDGHPCVKSKAVVTDDKGKQFEATVWNATDLKNFPVKIEYTEGTSPTTLLFKEIKLAKPDNDLFTAPSDFKRYESTMSLMQQEMMKRLGGGAGVPQPR